MGGIFDPQNHFWQWLSKFCDIFGLSMCWLVCCLPVVTAGAATCALYDAVYHGIRRGEPGVYVRFFKTFAREFKTATLATLPFLLLALLLLILSEVTQVMALGGSSLAGMLVYAYAVVFCLFLVIWLFAMTTLSRFTFKAGELLRTALQLVFSHLPSALAVALIVAVGTGLMGWWYFSCIFAPALMAYLCTFPVEKIFAPFLSEEEEDEVVD